MKSSRVTGTLEANTTLSLNMLTSTFPLRIPSYPHLAFSHFLCVLLYYTCWCNTQIRSFHTKVDYVTDLSDVCSIIILIIIIKLIIKNLEDLHSALSSTLSGSTKCFAVKHRQTDRQTNHGQQGQRLDHERGSFSSSLWKQECLGQFWKNQRKNQTGAAFAANSSKQMGLCKKNILPKCVCLHAGWQRYRYGHGLKWTGWHILIWGKGNQTEWIWQYRYWGTVLKRELKHSWDFLLNARCYCTGR